MKIFLGIFLASLTNFLLGIIGYNLVFNSNVLGEIYQLNPHNLEIADYLRGFVFKFFVISVLTWILFKVMPLLDKPRKRVLFIYLLGTIFTVYNEVDIFWGRSDIAWSFLIILSESFNWLITAYVLSKFIKPRHLGAF